MHSARVASKADFESRNCISGFDQRLRIQKEMGTTGVALAEETEAIGANQGSSQGRHGDGFQGPVSALDSISMWNFDVLQKSE